MVGIGPVIVYCIILTVGFSGCFRVFSALLSSISLEAARRLIAMWLGVCRLGMCSSSALVMFWTYDRTRSVGSLA